MCLYACTSIFFEHRLMCSFCHFFHHIQSVEPLDGCWISSAQYIIFWVLLQQFCVFNQAHHNWISPQENRFLLMEALDTNELELTVPYQYYMGFTGYRSRYRSMGIRSSRYHLSNYVQFHIIIMKSIRILSHEKNHMIGKSIPSIYFHSRSFSDS